MALTHTLRQQDGFSMTELMVVLVIIGILTILALPRFMNVTTTAKMMEAKMALKQAHALQMTHFFEHDVYAPDLATLRYEQPPLTTDGGTARYRLAIESASDTQFVVTATSVVDFDRDGTFNVWFVKKDGTIRERMPD